VGGIDLDIHLAGAYRGTGASELVLAGLVRATFTRGYIANQNPEVTASERPWKVTGWAHKGNQPLRSLLRTFGFTYDSARTLEPGYRAGGFGLVGGLIAGPNENTAQTAATMKAAKKLDQFQVRASGPVKIADKPVELFERLGYKELRS
jgi:hypothetical protein